MGELVGFCMRGGGGALKRGAGKGGVERESGEERGGKVEKIDNKKTTFIKTQPLPSPFFSLPPPAICSAFREQGAKH